VAFSPDGWLVLTGSYDDTARLWEAASGKAVTTLSGQTGEVSASTDVLPSGGSP
jgi:WD40 repeat protein